jgi:hypothetical protein
MCMCTHNMVYLYDACDQISDFCHQQLLRKMRRKISWTDGRTEVKRYTSPPPRSGSGGIINKYTAKLGYRHPPQVFNIDKNLQTVQDISDVNIIILIYLFIIPPLPERGGGEVYRFTSVLPSVQDIFRRIFLNNL